MNNEGKRKAEADCHRCIKPRKGTEYYSEVYGLEMNQGLNEVWHQTFNTQTQGKSIADIVDEQYRNSISIIASYQ